MPDLLATKLGDQVSLDPVWQAVSRLSDDGLLEEQANQPAIRVMTRRAMMQKVALAGSVALITSIAVPASAALAACIANPAVPGAPWVPIAPAAVLEALPAPCVGDLRRLVVKEPAATSADISVPTTGL